MKEKAQRLIELGHAEGLGMMQVIEAIEKIINIEGEVATDGEVVDLIINLINN